MLNLQYEKNNPDEEYKVYSTLGVIHASIPWFFGHFV